MMNRRSFLLTGSAALTAAPGAPLIETHLHLFASDQKKFPYHRDAVYKPEARDLDPYLAFAKQAGIDGVVIVHPEPYQDDHSYLEYCFAHEHRKGFFKGTCLFDPTAPETPDRMAALVKRNPDRIVALRIHENREAGVKPTAAGPIRDRDLKHPGMKAAWRKAGDLGLAIQMHLIPLHAPEITDLAREFSSVPVILDHLARAGQGTPEQYNRVLAMAKLPNVHIKFSAVRYSSKQPPPHRDTAPLVKRTFDAFGPDRIIWGVLGTSMQEFKEHSATFEALFDFASSADRAKIRGGNAVKLFRFRV